MKAFRAKDDTTPIVLMGYYNPIYVYGVDRFVKDAKAAGVDGLIIVDLPPEEDDELCIPAMKAGLNFIRLTTPTTDDKRAPAVFKNTSGFVYYVSVLGITGTKAPDLASVKQNVVRLKGHTDLPIAVGFGVKTAEQARAIAKDADGVVVGSALVTAVRDSLDQSRQGHGEDAEGRACYGERNRQGRRGASPRELDQELRPPQNPLDPGRRAEARRGREHVDQGSRFRPDGLLQGPRGQPVRDARLRPPHEDAAGRAAQIHVRRWRVGSDRHAAGCPSIR